MADLLTTAVVYSVDECFGPVFAMDPVVKVVIVVLVVVVVIVVLV